MSLEQTSRLGLPLLAAGQAQKEIAHNEALLRLDLLTQGAVLSADLAMPPAAPVPGACWIVAAGATGAWAGQAAALAGWTDNGWRFAAPGAGWRLWVADRGHMMRFDGAVWIDEMVRDDGMYVAGQRVLAARQAAVADPAGGATVDSEARATLAALLARLRAHGLIEI
jgi:hypothetical protein